MLPITGKIKIFLWKHNNDKLQLGHIYSHHYNGKQNTMDLSGLIRISQVGRHVLYSFFYCHINHGKAQIYIWEPIHITRISTGIMVDEITQMS